MSSTPSDALDAPEPRSGGRGRAGARRAANDQKPMRTLIGEQNIDFLGKSRIPLMVSGAMLVVAILAIAIRGLAFGVDFTGGYTIEVGYAEAPDVNAIRQTLEDAELPPAQVQTFGTSTDILIRMAPREADAGDENADSAPGAAGASVADEVVAALRASADSDVEIRRQEFVGPQVGEELRETGGLALLTALAGILLYVWMRFEKKLAIGSVLALVHDVTIVVGFFALFGIEFDLTILAALLAVIGYSLNDTVVVFDRIRENFRTMRRGTPHGDHERGDQPDADAHDHHLGHDHPRAAVAVLPRRPDHPRLLARAARRHRRRHLLLDLRREPRGAEARHRARGPDARREGRRGPRRDAVGERPARPPGGGRAPTSSPAAPVHLRRIPDPALTRGGACVTIAAVGDRRSPPPVRARS